MIIQCCIPQRALLAIMLFTACAISYMLRVNMSISIIAMSKEETKNNTKVIPACLAKNINSTIQDNTNEEFEKLINENIDEEIRYNWDRQTQATILGAYFWGQIITCAPGGIAAERYGATKTIFISTIVASICTFIIPFAAMIHWFVIWLLRFITGLMAGVIYPSLHCLISRWAPPEEKGKFIGALLGGSLGTVLTWPLLGIIIEKWGWYYSFFLPSIISILWSLIWLYTVKDTPKENKWITDTEKEYIENSLKDNLSNKEKLLPPYKQFIKSLPVWAFVIAHFGNSWGLFFLMTSGPKYMSTVLGFNLGKSGFLSAMPYLARMIFGFMFGLIGDVIRKNKWLTTTKIRKSFILCSHIIPGLLLLLLTSTECNVLLTVILITFSLGINGASSITNLANSQDLAPIFAGSLYGIANALGASTGFISPAITGYITKDNNGIEEWRTIFHIGGIVYILSGLIFIIFGSGENQNFTKIIKQQSTVNDPEKNGIENTGFEKDTN